MDQNIAVRAFKLGERVRFKTSGHEIAHISNPNPPETAEGVVNGEVVLNHMVHGGGYIPLWCEREKREATTVYVCLGHILSE